MNRPTLLPFLLVLITLTGAAALARASETSRVLGSIDIAAGEHTGNVSTVNGSIHIGASAVVGTAHTVNGSIEVEDHATATELQTVNGSIELSDSARVSGDVQTVNGKLKLENGVDVAGQLRNVNGSMHIAAAHVAGGIHSTTGNIEIGPNARIEGGIHMEKESGRSLSDSVPHVVVGPGSVVSGILLFERPVKLYVSDGATIGAVQGASVIKFSGDHPPAD
jgi:cytoskeletal protein CcmA (bactofilin family)